MSASLSSRFSEVIRSLRLNAKGIDKAWLEIENFYTERRRHYHNLNHLEAVLHHLKKHEDSAEWNRLFLSTIYHDVVYIPALNDNEEQSARFAARQLKKLIGDNDIIEVIQQDILATKEHKPTSDELRNLFIDADLSILAADWKNYVKYFICLRREFLHLSDLEFKSGRSYFLKKFLDQEFIFTSDHYRKSHEPKARENMKRELRLYEGIEVQ